MIVAAEVDEDGKTGFDVRRVVANRQGKTLERWFETREEAEYYKERLEKALLFVSTPEAEAKLDQAAQLVSEANNLMKAAGDKMPYGDVEYADPGYQKDGKKRYPIDTAEHCRAAWSYINHPHNESMYTPQQVAEIKSKIRAAAKKLGVDISG